MFVCSTLHCHGDEGYYLNGLLFNQENKLRQFVMERINVGVLFRQSSTPHGEDIPGPMNSGED